MLRAGRDGDRRRRLRERGLEPLLGHLQRPARRVALGEQPLDLPPRFHGGRHVDAMHEDPGPRSVLVGERLVDEVHVALRERPTVRFDEAHRDRVAGEWLPRRQHGVEEADEALLRDLRQRLRDRKPRAGASGDQPIVRGVRVLEPVLRAAEHRHERRRLVDDRGELRALGVERTLQPHALGDLLADDENAGDRAVVVAHRAVAVGPPDLL